MKASLILATLFASISLHAQDFKYPTLSDLDAAIGNSSYYQSRKEETIARKYERLSSSSTMEDRFWRLSDLYSEYTFYQLDSALMYATRMLSVAKDLGRSDLQIDAQLKIAEEYIQQGLYFEADKVLSKIERSSVPQQYLSSYFYKYNALYEALSDFTIDMELQHVYKQKEYAYKDSLLTVDNNIYVASLRYLNLGYQEKSIKILLDAYDQVEGQDRSIGPLAYAISRYYRAMGNRMDEKKYLIASALSDVRNSIKEYLSLRRLSEILYEEGDYSRAHHYIEKCMADASFSNARLRMVQVSEVLPLLEAAYQQKLHKQVTLLSVAVFLVLVLLGIVVLMVITLRKQKIKLDEANKLLSEAGDIKNIYIFNLLMECVARIDTLDNYRRSLNKKALAGDKNAVFAELRSTDSIDEQWHSFYDTFDSTFLKIVPSFVEKVNELMRPECAFECKGGTLPVEMRILALIRLGVTETDRIASILKYSKSTIYAYRSRTRLKAKNPDDFEAAIMHISAL